MDLAILCCRLLGLDPEKYSTKAKQNERQNKGKR
jgi:hypothetical protein